MSVFIKTIFNAIALILITLPSIAFAQVEVSSAKWKNVTGFQYCVSGKCEIFKKIELSTNTIKIGEHISVMNSDTETEISKFLVKSIKYGRQVKMCWIGDSEGISGNYITVGGCSLN